MEVEVSVAELLNPNKALMDRAREMLDSDDEFCEALERWLKRQCSTVQAYSEQNQAMLLLQCMDRNLGPRKFSFTQVQAFNGWIQQGRAVRKGEKGFVISARVTAANPTDDDGLPVKDEDGKVKKGGMRGFRWLFVFDVSQTEELTLEQVAAITAARSERAGKGAGKGKGKGRKR